jgi:hypothetical protein
MSILSSERFACFQCGFPYSVQDRIGRNDVCPRCEADLHCCRNCRHYNPRAHNECNEPQAEWVREKDRSNYCDYFDSKRGGEHDRSGAREDAKSRFEDLFKSRK